MAAASPRLDESCALLRRRYGTVDSDILAGVTAIIGLWLGTRACLTILFPTALLGFLLWALPCVSNGTRLTVVFLTFSVLAQGGGGVRHMTSETFMNGAT